MSLACYLVLDRDDPGFDTFVNGKAVAHALDDLEALCCGLGLPTLESFMGQSIDAIEHLLGEDIDLPEGDDGEAQWFDPAEGIALIDAIASAIQQSATPLPSAAAVLDDLGEFKAVLEQARTINARWHLAMDF